MKKILSIFIVCAIVFSFAGCNNNETENGESIVSSSSSEIQSSEAGSSTPESSEAGSSTPESSTPESSEVESSTPESSQSQEPENTEPTAAKALVVYFSATGTTEAVAEALTETQNADVYEIIPDQPYTDADLNYNDRTSRATVEQNDASARPSISGGVSNIGDYDVIYVGFPIWWGDMPRIMFTFFDSYDLSGKTIAPFATSGGSGISGAVRSIEGLEPTATVTSGLLANGSNTADMISQWLDSIGLAE